ncbi:aldehyde dehydrogenase family protein [Nonomuraea angiospora]|uniref:aldehyde dehydrogenase family protein n=1 Tax=Nonomuraea angiospora TaxID=46172 RepID=UPI0033C7775C
MELCRNETFGPVVALYPFSTEDEAVELANDTVYGLNASIWTSSPARARRLTARVNAGTVNINEGYASAYASYDAPMGGVKASGLGRRHGVEGLLRYTEARTVAPQAGRLGFEPPAGVPYEKWADILAGALKVMRKLRIK